MHHYAYLTHLIHIGFANTFLVLSLDILHCLPRAVGVLLESALNLVSRMSHDLHELFSVVAKEPLIIELFFGK